MRPSVTDESNHHDPGRQIRLISIVTIVRNDRPGLQRTCASLTKQTFRDFEWHVVDGASTDGAAELALSFHLSGLAHATSAPDQGIFDAMNRGLARATGEYVVFMNAGDEFASEKTLARVAQALELQRPDLLYGNSLARYHGDRLSEKLARGHQRLAYGMFACHQTLYYKRDVLGDLHYDTALRIAGDYDFTARFMQRARKIIRLPLPLAIFDLSGMSSKQKDLGRKENWIVQREVLQLSLARRLTNRIAYLLASFVAERTPLMYKLLRYRR